MKSHADAFASFEDSLTALGCEYVDLLLIHAPWPWSQVGADCSSGNAEVWRAMEGFAEAGLARAIGVSNFLTTHLQQLLRTARTVPAVNQIKYHVGNRQAETVDYCRRHGILVEGYSPLGTGRILGDSQIAKIAHRYGVSSAQLCIRYVVQNDVVALPKTTSPARMLENADTDFEISPTDMAVLDDLDAYGR